MRTRDLQKETGGFTEFVPLPFVHMAAPIYLQRKARRGPTFREVVLMHAVGRIAYHGHIDNIQASWVKLGLDGVRQLLQAGVQRPRRHADGREHLPCRGRDARSGDGRSGFPSPRRRRSVASSSSAPPSTAASSLSPEAHHQAPSSLASIERTFSRTQRGQVKTVPRSEVDIDQPSGISSGSSATVPQMTHSVLLGFAAAIGRARYVPG